MPPSKHWVACEVVECNDDGSYITRPGSRRVREKFLRVPKGPKKLDPKFYAAKEKMASHSKVKARNAKTAAWDEAHKREVNNLVHELRRDRVHNANLVAMVQLNDEAKASPYAAPPRPPLSVPCAPWPLPRGPLL